MMKKYAFLLLLFFAYTAGIAQEKESAFLYKKQVYADENIAIELWAYKGAFAKPHKRFDFRILNKSSSYMVCLGLELPPGAMEITSYYREENESKEVTLSYYTLLKNERSYVPEKRIRFYARDTYNLTKQHIVNEIGTFALADINHDGEIPMSLTFQKFSFYLTLSKIKIRSNGKDLSMLHPFQQDKVLFGKGFDTELDNDAVILFLTPEEKITTYEFIDFSDAIDRLTDEAHAINLKINLSY